MFNYGGKKHIFYIHKCSKNSSEKVHDWKLQQQQFSKWFAISGLHDFAWWYLRSASYLLFAHGNWHESNWIEDISPHNQFLSITRLLLNGMYIPSNKDTTNRLTTTNFFFGNCWLKMCIVNVSSSLPSMIWWCFIVKSTKRPSLTKPWGGSLLGWNDQSFEAIRTMLGYRRWYHQEHTYTLCWSWIMLIIYDCIVVFSCSPASAMKNMFFMS